MTSRLSSTERRKDILDKSLKIIYEHGFYDLTIRNIAAEIGISEAAIYRHFDNKEEIVANLAEEFFCHDQYIEEKIIDMDIIKWLKKIFIKQMEIFENNPLITVIIFQEEIFREYPEIWQRFNKHREQREDLLKKIIKSGQEGGELARTVNPEAFAILFMGAIRMTVIKWRGSDFSFSLLKKSKEILYDLLKILQGKDELDDSNTY